MITIDNVSLKFDQSYILKKLNLKIREKRVAIIGANGSGKSSFAKLLNALHLPSEGRILVDGLDTRKNSKDIRKKVGFVFQNPDNQIVFPVVEEDLAFGLKNIGYEKEQLKHKIEEILSSFGILHLKQFNIHNLSDGQKQLIAIAGVVIMNPKYIVFDEPTTLLDLRNKNLVYNLIRKLTQRIIMVTHDLELLDAFEMVIWFDNNQIVMDDLPEIIVKEYKAYYSEKN